MKVLVVVNNEAVLDSLNGMLTAYGYYADTACNGLGASEKYKLRAMIY